MTDKKRETIFISHATPGDNVFATWIASRLSMAGYKVWCDQEQLLGGEDFWQDIEEALRNETIKFVLVVSQSAYDENGRIRDGIQKEIGLANILKRQLNDDYFIVPVRIDETSFSDFSIDFLRLNGVDCSLNWANGFEKLLKIFDRDSVPKSAEISEPSLEAWRKVHQFHSASISNDLETVQSNWLEIIEFPEHLNFYTIKRPVKSNEPRAIASTCSLPCEAKDRLLVSFAQLDELQDAVGEAVPIKLRARLKTLDFISDAAEIQDKNASLKISSIIRQAWNTKMLEKGLHEYEMANFYSAWWFPDGLVEKNKIHYIDYNDKKRSRAVIGIKGKKEVNGEVVPRNYWHLGMTARAIVGDASHILLQPRIIISENKKTPLESKVKLNSMRRTLTKKWFNDRWRGLVLGFSTWVGNEDGYISLNVGENAEITVSSRPMTFKVPLSIHSDPANSIVSDEQAERLEEKEEFLRLSDPAFYLDDENADEDETS